MQNVKPRLEPKIPEEKQQDFDKLHQKYSVLKNKGKNIKSLVYGFNDWSRIWATNGRNKRCFAKAQTALEQEQTFHKPKNPIDIKRAKEIVTMFNKSWSVLTSEEKRQIVQELIKQIEFEKKDRKIKILDIQFY